MISPSRAPLTIAALVSLGFGTHTLGVGLMLAAFLTDTLARTTGATFEWDRVLDAASDKLAFAVLGVGLCVIG